MFSFHENSPSGKASWKVQLEKDQERKRNQGKEGRSSKKGGRKHCWEVLLVKTKNYLD